MATTLMTPDEQLAGQLDAIAEAWQVVGGRAPSVGPGRRRRMIEQLEGGDVVLAAGLLGLLYPWSLPAGEWWRSPLGELVAGALLEAPDVASWSIEYAADVLGVSRGTVDSLLSRGEGGLERAPGGVTRSSTLRRLARLRAGRNPTGADRR